MTLPEVIIVVLLIAIVSMLTNVSIKILNSLKREGARVESTRDAHVFLYRLGQEIRNAKSILSISPDSMVLTAYDFSMGYDYDEVLRPRLFNPTRISTITYTCGTYAFGQTSAVALRRVEDGPFGIRTKYFFNGSLVMPANANPDLYYEVFSKRIGVTNCPCDYVQIDLRLTPGFHKQQYLRYSTDAAVRAFAS